jgi:hypothetical protein
MYVLYDFEIRRRRYQNVRHVLTIRATLWVSFSEKEKCKNYNAVGKVGKVFIITVKALLADSSHKRTSLLTGQISWNQSSSYDFFSKIGSNKRTL